MPELYSVRIKRRNGSWKTLRRFPTEKEGRDYIEFNGNRSATYAVFERGAKRWPEQMGGQKRRGI